MDFKASELILNADGSIYHLGLKPENLAPTVISVGDPDRVDMLATFLDSIEFQTRKREFHSLTGKYQGKRLSVVSTGIGTDNIDIVLNELDALVNIDFKTRKPKPVSTSLEIIRIGTSGAIQEHIPIDSFLLSETAIGFDNLMHFYRKSQPEDALLTELMQSLALSPKLSHPYLAYSDAGLNKRFSNIQDIQIGITATLPGFYAPQGRKLRGEMQNEGFMEKLKAFRHKEKMITNFEMETAGIYGMADLLGHRAVSLNVILANRITGEFSADPQRSIRKLIEMTLEQFVSS